MEEGELLSCAADHDGRNRLRGDVEPVIANELSAVISSPFADGPADVKLDAGTTCDLALSVEEVSPLPLRFRLLYFSISSASRSRIRSTMGDKNDDLCVGAWGFNNVGCEGPGEDTETVPLLLAEDTFSGRWEEEWMAGVGRGHNCCDGEDDNDDKLVPIVPTPESSISPLSVVVVAPEPLRMRTPVIPAS